jgi:hypothetical protein
MHFHRPLLVFAVLALELSEPPDAWAAPRGGARVISEFEVGANGDFLLLPLVINQREYRFLVSTGLSTTVVDRALADRLDLKELQGTFGKGAKPRFGGLRATLGSLELDLPNGVEASDYSAMQNGLDLDFHGEIGMDVLRSQIVEIDFDAGTLRFLASVPPGAGEILKTTTPQDETGVPTLPVIFPGLPAQRFIVSTARAGNALDITQKLLTQLEDKEKATILAEEKGVTRSGTLKFKSARIDSMQVGNFRHEGMIANSGELNGIGLSYLARYNVTFDFPRGRVFLKKGAHFRDPDSRLEMWAVTVGRENGTVTLQTVGHELTGRLGLRAADVLESLNGHDVRKVSNWQIRRTLGRSDIAISAVVRRGRERLTLHAEPAAAAAADSSEPAK